MKALTVFLSLFIITLFSVSGISNATFNVHNADSTQLCIVSGEKIEGSGVKYKYLNKDVVFCCDGCVSAFKKEPASYMKESLHCPVCNEDDAKKDLSHTHDGVKYYFCGSGCKGKFEKDAGKYLENYK